jgi:hypothetical protein
MPKEELHHEIDMWGYYCESWCRACETDRRVCERCDLNHGSGQFHSLDQCNQHLQAEKDKQLSFSFMNS